jgi:hypothetical protein
MGAATDKQISYIIQLANELMGTSYRYLEQVRGVLPTSVRNMTGSDASLCIEDLQKQLAAKDAAAEAPATPVTPVATGTGCTAEEVLAMLGRDVEITIESGTVFAGTATRIFLREATEKRPGGVAIELQTSRGSFPNIRVSVITGWTITR